VAQGISFLVVVHNRAVSIWKHVKNSLGTKKVYENIVFRYSEKRNFKKNTVFWDMLERGLVVGSHVLEEPTVVISRCSQRQQVFAKL